jgi:murein DD-endopeptidase MepM/ murein hydrolase activator NlpD
MKRRIQPAVLLIIMAGLIMAFMWLISAVFNVGSVRDRRFFQWARGGEEERAALVTVQREPCPGAPFVLPSDGFIGLLYGDPNGPYTSAAPHQGIDIFSDGPAGITPVYAAADGYISRESGWRSALIQRIPNDPLHSGRTIWLYYAHMADREGNSFIESAFPPGAHEVFVEQGTLLGYTGDYNGDSLRDIWVHLHFSIVLDDGLGRYTNELEFANTIDPSPYLGLPLNYSCRSDLIQCGINLSCTVLTD